MQSISPGKAALQFDDAQSCERWVSALPLTNVQAAQLTLAQQVALLRTSALPAADILRIVETLRPPIAFVQRELARRYAGRSLPLEPSEAAAWNRAVGLWDDLAATYLVCREAHIHGDRLLQDQGALIMMRSLQYSAAAMVEYYRVYRQVPAALWRNVHHLYVFAEQSGFAQAVVGDPDPDEPITTCQAAYMFALLAQLANPFALSGRQMGFVMTWTGKWAGLASLSAEPLPPSSIPALAVDLAGCHGPVFAEGRQPLPSLRHLGLEQLGRTLRQIITLLKQGQTPAQLGLGDDARQPGCENLLMLLYIQWCRAGTARDEPRNTAEDKAQVCLGMHASHFHVSSRAFRAPGASLTRQEEHDMQLFGHISDRTERMLASGQSSAVESWDLINQSTSGFLCMMRDPDAQMRISHNQLVSVRRTSGKAFYLGIVQWLRMEESNEMYLGIRLFPGIPRAVAVRPANFNMPGITGYERGLLLPEIAAPATPVTVVLPSGWFQAGRFIELHAEQKQVAKLVSLLEKGSDFDRCTVSLT